MCHLVVHVGTGRQKDTINEIRSMYHLVVHVGKKEQRDSYYTSLSTLRSGETVRNLARYATWRGTHSLGNPEHLCKHQALRCSLNIVSSVKRTAHIKNALGALTQGVEDNNWDIVYSERREPPYGYEVE